MTKKKPTPKKRAAKRPATKRSFAKRPATKRPAAKKRTANGLPLNKFVKGEIRITRKAGKKLVQFRKA